jgi:hypothetical protein
LAAPSARAKLTLVLFSALCALGVGEVVLRVTGVSSPNFYRPDPVRGWGLAAGEEGWWTSEGHAWVHINRDGERDSEHALAKPAGTLRIAVLGDSCTEALQVSLEQTFWKQMEPAVRSCARRQGWRDAEVLDFGVAGYGTAQELLTLEEKAWRYTPDIVVLAFYGGNDVRNNFRALEQDASRPYFVLRPTADGRRELALDDSFRSTWGFRLRRSFPARALYGVFNHSRLLELAKRGQGTLDGWIGSIKARHKERGTALQELGLDNAVYATPRDADWTAAWDVTEAIVKRMHEEVAAHGARFGLLNLTTPIEVDPDPVKRARFMAQLGVSSLDYPDERLAHLGSGDGFPVLTLAPLLRPIAERRHLYLHGFPNTAPGEGHWNAAGHAAAAPFVSSWICSSLLARPHSPAPAVPLQ